MGWFAAIVAWLFVCSFSLGSVESKRSLLARGVGVGKAGCVDKSSDCQGWGRDSQCILNPYFTRDHCAKTCGTWKCGSHHGSASISHYATAMATHKFAHLLKGVESFSKGLCQRDPSMGEFLVPNQHLRSDPWLTLSTLGVGTYLGSADEDTDNAVASGIVMSIAHGWNILDTASNYRDGRGEKAVGEALKSLVFVTNHGISREMLFISTKTGFTSRSILEALISSGKITKSDIAGGMNCIHPECIMASIGQSLKNMNIKTVDLLYLHNAAEVHLPDVGVDVFFRRLRAAFETLEELRKSGKIRAYGMATWDSFRVPPQHKMYVSLEKVVELAREVGGVGHGFRYIQLPVNLKMPEAWLEKWQVVKGEELCTLEAAALLGVGSFASGPLMEANLVNNLPNPTKEKLMQIPVLKNIQGIGPKLLQLVRSTPYLTSTLVGQKSAFHVEQNIALSGIDPLTTEQFFKVMAELLPDASVEELVAAVNYLDVGGDSQE
ncbi:hypothetical protein BSKO_10429 [Bryopsis sp. KO-2023]|nr:hypothetical protein BSKO_10429 [Bryopsis sp. KO-2023]